MRLFLIRHGLAHWPVWDGPDDDRPLNPTGEHQTAVVGQALARLGLKPDWILHSPLLRARQTAHLTAAALGAVDRVRACPTLQPGFNASALTQLLKEYGEAEELLLVGHAPDMGQVVHTLTGGQVAFKEGTVALIKIDQPADSPAGKLVWLAPVTLLALA